MYPTNQPAKPPATFGSLQNSFVFKLYQMKANDQFTVIEDIPRSKVIRSTPRLSSKGNTYPVLLIKVSKDGFEADIEMMESEFQAIVITCPKDTPNLKGHTFAFDGYRWSDVSADNSPYGFQPNVPLNAPMTSQIDQQLKSLCDGIKAADLIGAQVNTPILMKIAEKVIPGDALGIITYAKTKGAIYEKDGVYKVT